MTRRVCGGACFATALCMVTVLSAAPAGTPVADAARRGDRDEVRALLQQGADVRSAHADGMTALHWAAERGDADMAEMLVYAGANVGAVTRIGQYTPLHLASKTGNTAVVNALLKAGAAVDAKTSTTGVTPLHLAAASGNTAIVETLVDKGAEVNATESEWGQTPLIFAASMNRVEAIKVLLARGANPSIATKSLDLTHHAALDRAASERYRKVLEATVPKGQRPTPSQIQAAIEASRELYASGKIPPPEKPAEPAAATARTPAPAAGAALAAGAAPAAPATPAAPAAEPPAANAPAGTAATPAPAVPAQSAVNPRDPEEINPTVASKGGLTALLHAARQGYVEAARALIDGGASINEVSAGDATSPLLMAVINGQFDMAMFLLSRGADPNLYSSGNGVTPLWAAVNAQWQPRTRFPQPQEMGLQKATYLDVMKVLLDAGADPNGRLRSHPWYMVYTGCGNRNCGLADTSGSTAFWRAAYSTDIEAMRLLVQYGADPNIPTIAPQQQRRRGPQAQAGTPGQDAAARAGQGNQPPGAGGAVMPTPTENMERYTAPVIPYGGPGAFPLHAAAGVEYGEGFAGNAHRHAPDGWLPAVKFLVEEMGADVNARDNDGYTPLHHAAARGDNETILYLVSKGADVTAVARSGQTTADMANGPVQRVSPFPETVALLMKLGSKNNNRCVSC